MIGEKHQGALLGFVPDFDATQKQIVVPRADRFIKEARRENLWVTGVLSA
jgi:hypothetical protein